MALSLITLTHGTEGTNDLVALLQAQAGNRNVEVSLLQKYFNALGAGVRLGTVKVGVAAVQASGTLTLSTAVATNTAVVNGVTFTCVASGATGNQFNVGGTDTLTAAALAAAINASVTAKVASYVTAVAVGAVVTVSAVQPGLSGNLFTLSATGGIAAGASALAGGTAGTEVSYAFGQ